MKDSLKRILAAHAPGIAQVADELARRGWAEANAGNISVRLQNLPASQGRLLPLDTPYRRLARCSFLIKQAGARMRDIARAPGPGLCLLQIGDDGRSCHVLPEDAQPSSELPSHLAAHETMAKHRPDDTTVLHTHPTATIALSLLVKEPRELVPLLTRMHSEGPLMVYGRVAAIGFQSPGSEALAKGTAAALRTSSGVIWPLHGMVATGPDPAAALDLVEVVDKAAKIALALGERRMLTSGLTSAQEMAVREAFGRD